MTEYLKPYEMIPTHERAKNHFKIGKLFLKQTLKSKMNERIIPIVNQLNRGSDTIQDLEKKTEGAKLNLQAAKKAKASSAYFLALTYCKKGIALLTGKKWKEQDDLTLGLYKEAAENAFFSTQFDDMEKLARIAEYFFNPGQSQYS